MFRLVKLCMVMMLLSVCAFGFVAPQSAFACSGGPAPMSSLVELADVFVRGRLVEVDEDGQNAIMEVDSSIMGEPLPQYIVLALNDPANIETVRERSEGGLCFYGVSPRLTVDREIAIFLTYNLNGSYNRVFEQSLNPHYYSVDASVYSYIAGDPPEVIELTFEEFWDSIEDLADSEAIAPRENTAYPRLAPALITTESGMEYLLPVDSAIPLQPSAEEWLDIRRDQPACWVVYCHAWSPNGVDHFMVSDAGTIRYAPDNERNYPLAEGEAFMFSSTSDAIAIWDVTEGETVIQIYGLNYQRIRRNRVQLINAFPIELAQIIPENGAWSPDGRMFAFSDDRGVWLWDALTVDAQPELINDTPMSIAGFSPTGRHLTLGEGADGWSIDLVNGNIYPAGVFSPDDRILAAYGEQLRIIELTPYNILDMRLEGQPIEIAWYDNSNHYIVMVCEDLTDRSSCIVNRLYRRRGVSSLPILGYDFDFHPDTEALIVAQVDRQIVITPSNNSIHYEYDLSAWLDDEIASVEWLPPLFYYD